MDLIFLAFANSQEDPLSSLKDEYDEVYRLLRKGNSEGNYDLHTDPFVTIKKFHGDISKYREDLSILLYSGHAGRDNLLFDDKKARAEGISGALAQCKNIVLVVLNGCSTGGQVAELLENGIPLVIATSAPVDDEAAKRFSIHFFRSLAAHSTIQAAFDSAINEIKTYQEVHVHRGFHEIEDPEKGIWGLFYKEENSHLLENRLPVKPAISGSGDYVPNEYLIEGLMDGLEQYVPKIQFFKSQEDEGETVSKDDKRMAIISSLPTPIAKQLQKLLCPTDSDEAGYDKVSLIRLRQLTKSYTTMMEFLAFTILAQLWENLKEDRELSLDEKNSNDIINFINREENERSDFNFSSFINGLLHLFKDAKLKYYVVEELHTAIQHMEENKEIEDAFFHMESLYKNIEGPSIPDHQLQAQCEDAEKWLTLVLRQVGFIAKYTLAAVSEISIQNYRHSDEPTFRHKISTLKNAMGSFDYENSDLPRYTCNQSVFLLEKKKGKIEGELNLTPFIVDGNSFHDRSDKARIYFYSHRQGDKFYYKYVNKPKDAKIDTSLEQYGILRDQLNTFLKIIGNQPAVAS